MSKVFLGGSRNLWHINQAIRTRLRNLITNKHTVIVGDANGVDKVAQTLFAEEGYKNVVVYCMDGECRNNVGQWEIKSVDSGGRKKDFSYYAMKDARASQDADYGFMIWDGESKGTLNNVLNLIQQGKFVLVYRSPSSEFIQIRSADDIVSLVADCPSEVVDYLNKTIKFEQRVAAISQIGLGF
jgi:hypothetical protein